MPELFRKPIFGIVAEIIIVTLLLAAATFFYRPGLYTAASRMDEAALLVYPR
jgi:hypothetical protein